MSRIDGDYGEQGELFPDPRANSQGLHHRQPTDTERDASLSILPRTGTQRWRVLSMIAARPDGLTDHQLQSLLGMNPSSERPRRVELVNGGWIADSGLRRPTPSGDRAIVWIISAQAQTAMAQLMDGTL